MFLIKATSPLKILIAALACLVLCVGLFVLGYWQGHRGLREEMNALAGKGGNSGLGNNPAQFDSAHPAIPANATPEMKEFLENQATLADKMEALRKQSPNGTLSPQAFAQFREQNADLLKRQNELSQTIAQQQNKNTLAAPPVQIPPNASPKLQAYLTERDKLMRDQIAFMNKHTTDSLPARQAAMQQWRQENASRFQQLQQLAQAVGPAQASSMR